MKTVREKAYAKVNLFLDIVGEKDGFHMLDSVVVTVSLYDSVTLTKRKDDKIVLKTGNTISISDNFDNNAYKAAKLYCDTFGVGGVDVTLNKSIPVGGGLGGSSADISAVLRGLEKLYQTGGDVKALADRLGSDSGYMLTGGYARLKGRGEIVEPLDIVKKLYFVVIAAEGGVNTAECYAEYDKLEREDHNASADGLIKALSGGKLTEENFFNALYAPAARLNPKVKEAYEFIKGLCPTATLMTGSGSCVYGIFDTMELCQWAKEKAKYKFRNVFVLESLTGKELEGHPFFARNLYEV